MASTCSTSSRWTSIHWDGRIYFFSHDGKARVIEAAGEYKELAVNLLDTGFMASPAVVDNALILRTKTHLYRIEKSGNPRPTVADAPAAGRMAIPSDDMIDNQRKGGE